jgi:polyamine oxidase
MSSSPSFGLLALAAVLLALNLAQHGSLAATVGPRVIVVGAGMSGNNKAPIYVVRLCDYALVLRIIYIYICAVLYATHGSLLPGISAAKRLSEAGITDLLILEATDHIGGRMHKTNFAGINVELGANWVEGVNGGKMNPIWPIVNSTLKLRNFRSDFDYLAQNVYKEEYVGRSTSYRQLMSSVISYSIYPFLTSYSLF